MHGGGRERSVQGAADFSWYGPRGVVCAAPRYHGAPIRARAWRVGVAAAAKAEAGAAGAAVLEVEGRRARELIGVLRAQLSAAEAREGKRRVLRAGLTRVSPLLACM